MFTLYLNTNPSYLKLQFLSKTKLTACVFLAVVIFQVVHLVQGTSADWAEKCIKNVILETVLAVNVYYVNSLWNKISEVGMW